MKYLTILLSLFAFSASAEELSYNYLQVTFYTFDSEILGVDIDGDGFAISGHGEITENVGFSISAQDESLDDFDVDANSFSFGVNYHTPLSEGTDVILGVNFINAEVESPFFLSEDDTGNSIGVGIRSKLNNNVELGVQAGRTDLFDDTTTGFSLSLLVGSGDAQFGIGYGNADDTDTVAFIARLNI